jgi:hypothetical protein
MNTSETISSTVAEPTSRKFPRIQNYKPHRKYQSFTNEELIYERDRLHRLLQAFPALHNPIAIARWRKQQIKLLNQELNSRRSN